VLAWYHVVFIFWVEWLIVRWNVDLIIREFVFAEVFEEVGVSGTIEMDVVVVGVFRLGGRISRIQAVSTKKIKPSLIFELAVLILTDGCAVAQDNCVLNLMLMTWSIGG
jgi:hypothetical protein